MDTVTLVESQIDDGQRLLDRLGEKGFVVRAACWVKPADEGRWSLYIATPAVDEKGDTLPAYRQIIPVLQSLGSDWITSSDVKVVGAKHPIVQDALDVLRRFPHSTPIRSPRPLLGGIPVEDLFVYSPEKTPVKIYRLVFSGAPGDFEHLSFEPHDPHATLTVEGKEYPAQTDIEWVVAAPLGATLEANEIGRKVLAWDRLGHRMKSTANQVLTFAELGLHGFRVINKPA